ncbi:MAG: DUF1080 domain-containing protein [Calditrichaeota bacterium]|nr:DUF1080 domain-containing protein [Calditrichota bacterium]
MKVVKLFILGAFFLFCFSGGSGLYAQKKAPQKETTIRLTFENLKTGALPEGWKIEATNQKGPLATWQVIEDSTAPSGKKVLSLTKVNHSFGGTFNLCWTDQIRFLNGEIKVKFKANSGIEDQGGGVIWRAKDMNNYYISRYNPLENNFRIYYVKDGARRMLASARIKLPAHKWHELKITVQGDQMKGYLNGKELLQVKDHTFPEAGGVGLWTKADAETSFDDFEVVKRNSIR